MESRIIRLFKVAFNILQTHEIINHKKTNLFHMYYMTLLHDKFSHQEKNNQCLT